MTLYSVAPLNLSQGDPQSAFLFQSYLKGVASPAQADSPQLGVQVLAVHSGGLALYKSGDLVSQIGRCLADAKGYYEATFDAASGEPLGQYRAIEMKVNRPEITARTNTAYYAGPPQSTTDPAASSLGVPQAPLRTQARLVTLDVTVLDTRGVPVTGLKADDFRVQDAGRLQNVAHFEEHVGVKGRTLPQLLSDTLVDNMTASNKPPDGTLWNVIAVDLINTPKEDRGHLQDQLEAFAKTIPPGTPVALVSMADGIKVLSPFLAGQSELLASLKRGLGPLNVGGPANIVERGEIAENIDFEHQASLQQKADIDVERQAQRAQMTLEDFGFIAKWLGAYAGKKNVFWLSSGFPIEAKPLGSVMYNSLAASTKGQQLPMQDKTDQQLEAARVAIYPLDVRGRAVADIEGETSADTTGACRTCFSKDSDLKIGQRSEMLEVAHATGGVAIFSGDLTKSLLQGVQQSQSYYTLSYSPDEKSWDGVYHRSLEEDGDGLVVLNLAKGVASTDGMKWHLFTQRGGLPVDEIQTLMFARSGELWLAPLGHGITRWHGYGNWEGWTTAEGMSSDVIWAAARDRAGQIWTVNHGGLDKLDPVNNSIRLQTSSIPFNRLYAAVVDPRQHVWTGDDKGQVIDFDPASGRSRLATGQLGRVFQLYVDRRQRIWVCSKAGLSYFSPSDGWDRPHSGGNDLPAGYAWNIAESPDGTMWVSTGQGLFRFNNSRWEQIRLPFPGGSGYNFMIAVAPDGTLWSQSKSPTPVLHLRVTRNEARVIEAGDTSAIASDNVAFLETDSRGWIWVGSDEGVHVYNGARWVQCTQDDGLLWDDTDFHAFFADPDGSVWIGTSAGLSHLKHPERLFAETSPTVQIDEVRLANLAVDPSESTEYDLRKPTLNVRLLNTNYDRRSSITYRSKLEGLETEWQETDGGNLRFPALNAGHYRLRVIAYDQRLHLESKPSTFAFTVLEPWWRRTWFRVVEGLAGLILLIALWRFSVHLLMLRARDLELLVTERTLELEKEKAELLSTRSALLETTRRDSLTGLLNRAAIFDEMKCQCDAAFETGTSLAVAMADLDSFKFINDTYGHVFGDAVLRECAARLGRAVRPTDWLGRYGGEELLILMPGLQPSDAAHRMEDLRLALSRDPITYGDCSATVTCSFGVAWFDLKRSEVEALVSQADEALYLAKARGRNRVEFALKEFKVDEQEASKTSMGNHATANRNSLVLPENTPAFSRQKEPVDIATVLA